MRFPLVLALVGCTPIYDAQYNDRADELDEFRTEFRPPEDETSLIASGGNRIFWVAKMRPEDRTFMHSMIPGDPASELVYTGWSMNVQDLETFRFSDTWIIKCSFSSTRAFAVSDPAQMTAFDPMKNATPCAVDGNVVWMIGFDGVGDAFYDWVPPNALPTSNVGLNLMTAGIVGRVAGFGAIGNLIVAAEQDGDLYTVDVAQGRATWIHNDEPVVGNVIFDDQGILYETQSGPRFIELDGTDDPPDRSFADMVRDGGYHLSFKHGDIQQPAGEYFIHQRHIVYRGERGIFAYGLDSHNVIDLLLDRGEGIDLELAYHQPSVAGDQLFVIGNNSLGLGVRGPVYQVDLRDRLR